MPQLQTVIRRRKAPGQPVEIIEEQVVTGTEAEAIGEETAGKQAEVDREVDLRALRPFLQLDALTALKSLAEKSTNAEIRTLAGALHALLRVRRREHGR
jgi:hypothetical protein